MLPIHSQDALGQAIDAALSPSARIKLAWFRHANPRLPMLNLRPFLLKRLTTLFPS
jgi:hypothetical protein